MSGSVPASMLVVATLAILLLVAVRCEAQAVLPTASSARQSMMTVQAIRRKLFEQQAALFVEEAGAQLAAASHFKRARHVRTGGRAMQKVGLPAWHHVQRRRTNAIDADKDAAVQPGPLLASPFKAPRRKPCGPLISTIIRRTGHGTNPQTSCYRGQIITFEPDHVDRAAKPVVIAGRSASDPYDPYDPYEPDAPDGPQYPDASNDPAPPSTSLPDGYMGLVWYNLVVTTSSPHAGSSDGAFQFSAVQAKLPTTDIQGDYVSGFFTNTQYTFTLVSLYITALYHDDIMVQFYADTDPFYGLPPTLTVAVKAAKPTFVEFGDAFRGIEQLLMQVTGGNVLHEGYPEPADNKPFTAIDNINIVINS